MRIAIIMVLALAVPLVARADEDPEPPGKGGPELRKLKGRWTVVRLKAKGRELQPKGMTYTFDGDKLTVDNGRATTVSKVKLDAKKKPAVMELTREGTKTTTKMGLKLEKGELLLTLARPKDPNVNGDFSGDSTPVLVLTREKK